MKIETVAIDSLDLDPRNARKHDAKNLKAIADSLEQFGQRKPIVVWGKTVVAGNGTMAAARSLGWTEISIARVPDDWSSDQVKAYALADNRSAELAEWDDKVLASQLLELTEAEFDVELLGFEIPVESLQDVVEDELPEQVEPKSKLGDVWKLGRHRLLCGDSTDKATVEKLMDGNKADLVFTDPPYRMQMQGSKDNWVAVQSRKIENSIKDLVDFDPAAFLEIMPSYFDKTMNAYIFCSKDLVPDYLNWAISKKYSFNILFWKKPNALPLCDSHRPDVEYLILVRKNAIWNNGLPNVIYSKCLEFSRDHSTSHPTMKPIELITNELQISSHAKSVIVDPFGGSGSTLIACEQTDRTCFMMEFDPKYVDVIIARWEKLTGLTAELIEG